MLSYMPLLALCSLASSVSAAPTLANVAVGAVVNVANTVVNAGVAGVFNATAPLEGICTTQGQCTISVNGSITNMLVDGQTYSASASISGWCSGGSCYGASYTGTSTPALFPISCNTTSGICTGTMSGAATAIFSNGKQLQLWGWIAPAGYCANGTCTATVTSLSDPAYKA